MLTVRNPKRARFAPKATPKKRRVPEWRLQASVIAHFHKLEDDGWPFTCAGDQNAERRGLLAQAKAKVTGMTAGEADIRIYLPEGRLGLIELKAEDGTLSEAQIERHARLRELGHEVFVLEAVTVEEAVSGAVKILEKLLGRGK